MKITVDEPITILSIRKRLEISRDNGIPKPQCIYVHMDNYDAIKQSMKDHGLACEDDQFFIMGIKIVFVAHIDEKELELIY